ncbi:MAG TPA: beta-ketoacyl-[acyl-carrier-protein] synthase family protein [Pirellulales bacterium]|nr:beta-ketoacyl-[acyl-carrier-protein] synthase family protein [Pirellulales bacterium]
MKSRRVVITGLGLITPLGNTPEEFWDALVHGRSGIAPLSTMPVLPIASFGGEARGFTGDIAGFGPLEADKKKAIRKGLKVMCRESQMGVAAAQRAIADAALTAAAFNPERTGVVFGSDYMLSQPEELASGIQACVNGDGRFDFTRWAGEGMTKMEPLWLLKYLPNMPASHLAIYNDFRGPSNSITHREAASNLAIGEAMHIIARGHADTMLAGATGTRLHPMKAVHAAQTEELALRDGLAPEQAARPFDLHRSGAVLGEGAGAIVLEELDSAQKRGARIYGEVVGAGSSTVADRQRVAHRDQALAGAMRSTLRDAHAQAKDVGHIQAHGLGTRSCDADEWRAISAVFGPAASDVPVTAAKSYFGNLGAASGTVELIAGVMALAHGRLFPILNYQTPDPECPVRAVRSVDTSSGESFLNLSVTPQGQASCVMVRRWRE